MTKAQRIYTSLAVLTLGLAYLATHGQCDRTSRFCVVDVAGTRSAVGFEWATPAFYVSTAP